MTKKTSEATRKVALIAAFTRMLNMLSTSSLIAAYESVTNDTGNLLESAFGFEWFDHHHLVLSNLRSGRTPFAGFLPQALDSLNEQLDKADDDEEDDAIVFTRKTRASELYEIVVEREGADENADPVAAIINLIEIHIEFERLIAEDEAEG